MKIIALEEHFRNAAIEEAVRKALPPSQRDFFVASMALSGPPELEDLGIDRLKHMDAMGIERKIKIKINFVVLLAVHLSVRYAERHWMIR